MYTALVVDDNREPADLLCRMLALLGLSARPAYGARQAILAVQEEVPDITFVDLYMPGLNGFEVVGYIQRELKNQRAPFVLITVDDSEETKVRAKECGVSEVIVKPATVEALERVLRKVGMIT